MKCKLCHSSETKVIYQGTIRSGVPGMVSKKEYTVRDCQVCDTSFLDPFPDLKTEYESGEYRTKYNQSTQLEEYQRLHDKLDENKLRIFRLPELRGKTIVEFGCGGGSFLNMLRSTVRESYAVEPTESFHPFLKESGHQVFSYPEQLSSKHPEICDAGFSFYAIEHVEDPHAFLKDLNKVLKPGGLAYIATDNRHVLMGKMGIPEFDAFNYREVHPWQFSAKSFQTLASRNGFELLETIFDQTYPFENFVNWMKWKAPKGFEGSEILADRELNDFWKSWIERKGLADNFIVKLRKTGS